MNIPPEKLTLHRSKITRFRKDCARKLTGCILDCGGGLGDYLPYLNGNITVLDINLDILRILKYPQKVIADATVLPFADNVFDNVWACAMAQYIQINTFINELIRTTKNEGHILILVPNANSPWDKIKKLMKMETWWDQEGIVRHYTESELKQYGDVFGEIQFLPFERIFRKYPKLSHTLMLDIKVNK